MAPSSCCSLVWGDSRGACGAGSAWTWPHYWENVSQHSWQTAPRAGTADGGRVSWQRLTYYTYKGICKEPGTLEWTHGKYSTNIWCWSNKPLHKNMAKWEESGPWPVVLPWGQNLPHTWGIILLWRSYGAQRLGVLKVESASSGYQLGDLGQVP